MTIDHRTIPGIEWVSSPGPLRVGDYVTVGPGVIARCHEPSEREHRNRVIPHVRPLEVPEPCEPETPEVITYTAEASTAYGSDKACAVDGRCINEPFTENGWHPIGYCDWLFIEQNEADHYINRMVNAFPRGAR